MSIEREAGSRNNKRCCPVEKGSSNPTTAETDVTTATATSKPKSRCLQMAEQVMNKWLKQVAKDSTMVAAIQPAHYITFVVNKQRKRGDTRAKTGRKQRGRKRIPNQVRRNIPYGQQRIREGRTRQPCKEEWLLHKAWHCRTCVRT